MATNSSHLVETTSRFAQWRIDNFSSSNYKPNTETEVQTYHLIEKSVSFKIGNWNWRLFLFGLNQNLAIVLMQDIPRSDSHPIVSFNIRVVSFMLGIRKTFIHPEIRNMMLQNDPFIWELNDSLTGEFIIDIEFLDLKSASPNGGEPHSIWSGGFMQKDTSSMIVAALGRMLSESIHTDITIHASDGSIGAHRAILAARSSVFHSMFTHDLKEKEMSTINISDMSIEACKAFLNYIYSNLQHGDFLKHRLDLLIAADKYDISDLKDACEESLIEDTVTKNVLERLQYASMYRLPKLKKCCFQYLVKFGKIFFIREEFDAFMKCADRELVGEVVNEILSVLEMFLEVHY